VLGEVFEGTRRTEHIVAAAKLARATLFAGGRRLMWLRSRCDARARLGVGILAAVAFVQPGHRTPVAAVRPSVVLTLLAKIQPLTLRFPKGEGFAWQ